MNPGVSEIRRRIAAAVGDALDPVRESVFHPKLIGFDGGGIAGAFYSVEALQTVPADPRNRVTTRTGPAGGGVYARSTFAIRYLHRIKADAQVASYDAALDVELALLTSIAAVDYSGTGSLDVQSIDREVLADGAWVLITLVGRVAHVIEA